MRRQQNNDGNYNYQNNNNQDNNSYQRPYGSNSSLESSDNYNDMQRGRAPQAQNRGSYPQHQPPHGSYNYNTQSDMNQDNNQRRSSSSQQDRDMYSSNQPTYARTTSYSNSSSSEEYNRRQMQRLWAGESGQGDMGPGGSSQRTRNTDDYTTYNRAPSGGGGGGYSRGGGGGGGGYNDSPSWGDGGGGGYSQGQGSGQGGGQRGMYDQSSGPGSQQQQQRGGYRDSGGGYNTNMMQQQQSPRQPPYGHLLDNRSFNRGANEVRRDDSNRRPTVPKKGTVGFGSESRETSVVGGCAWWVSDHTGKIVSSGAIPVVQEYPSKTRLEFKALFHGLNAAHIHGVTSVIIKGSDQFTLLYAGTDQFPVFFSTVYHIIKDLHVLVRQLMVKFTDWKVNAYVCMLG